MVFPDFTRTIMPALVPADLPNGMRGSTPLYVTIKYTSGRLAIMGVEGPLPSGGARGSAGQCGVHPEAVPSAGFTAGDLQRLRGVWDRWHLNDLCPYSPEMAALGWPELAKRTVWGFEFSRTADTFKRQEAIKAKCLSLAMRGEAFVPDDGERELLAVPYSVTIWQDTETPPSAPAHMEPATEWSGNGDVVKRPERKTLGWLKPSEHPDGLLGRKVTPDDAHGYGCKWWRENVPTDVLEWLKSLPAGPPLPGAWARG